MISKALVAFAMQQEFSPWRRRHRFNPVPDTEIPVVRTTFGSMEVYVALAGAGAPGAPRIHDIVAQLHPSLAIVTGVAAGLTPEWRTGHLLAAQTVVGPEGRDRIRSAEALFDLAVQCGARPARALLTLPRIARSVSEKKHWAALAEAADMESLPLMRQWSASGIPSLALRVILDPVEMPMTCDFEAAMDSHGQVRLAKVVAQLARHPGLLPDLLRLARHSRRVLKILAGFLDRFCEHWEP